MSTNLQVAVAQDKIAEFCRRWHVVELALFGSVLHEGFRPDSDVDVLVAFAPGAKRSVLDLMRMKTELSELFGRNVDLVDKRVIEQSDNYIRRRNILDSAKAIYGA